MISYFLVEWKSRAVIVTLVSAHIRMAKQWNSVDRKPEKLLSYYQKKS
jgi:hypothetical protein